MLIGFDSSGKFEIAGDYAPSVMAAAVMPPDASREIAAWTAGALDKWGRSDLGEIPSGGMRDPVWRYATCWLDATTCGWRRS